MLPAYDYVAMGLFRKLGMGLFGKSGMGFYYSSIVNMFNTYYRSDVIYLSNTFT